MVTDKEKDPTILTVQKYFNQKLYQGESAIL